MKNNSIIFLKFIVIFFIIIKNVGCSKKVTKTDVTNLPMTHDNKLVGAAHPLKNKQYQDKMKSKGKFRFNIYPFFAPFDKRSAIPRFKFRMTRLRAFDPINKRSLKSKDKM